MLGLGSSLHKAGKVGKSIIRDGLVLKHGYARGSVQPVSTGAVYVSGSNDHVDLGNHFSSTFSGNFSLAMWIKPIDGGPGSEQSFIGSVDSSTDQVRVDLMTDGKLRFQIKADGDEGYVDTNAVIFADGIGKWTHVACTTALVGSGNTTMKIYINGVDRTTTTSTILSSKHDDWLSVRNLCLGGRNTSDGSADRLFSGYICNAGIWGATLTQPQIKSIMHKDYAALSASEKSGANLVSWWNLDETLGGSGGTSVVINNNDNTLGEELITGFTNGATYPFDTFTSSGKNISAAVETSGDWGGCASNTLNLTEGEVYKCTFNLTYNSGDDTIRVLLASTNTGAATAVVDEIYYTNTNGVNEVYFRVKTTDSSSYLQLGTWHESDVINFSVTDISLKRVSGNTGALS